MIKKYLENISPKAFEELCVDYMKLTRGKNLKIKGTRYVKDGGKDITGTHDTIPYEIWAECKKHVRSIGLSEISKNVVLVISEDINELIYFSVSDITQEAQKHISNVAAKHGFNLAYYYGESLFEEFLKLPLFKKNGNKGIESAHNKYLSIHHYVTKYQYNSIYESGNHLNLQRDNCFYIDIFFKNTGTQKLTNIQCVFSDSPYFIFYIKPYNRSFSLNVGCDRVVQVKCKVLNYNRKLKIPNLEIRYIDKSDSIHKETLSFGFVSAANVLYFPLIGNDINQFVKLIDKDKFTLHDYFPFILDIRGRSGVGKTRLIKELADKAENHDCKVKQYDARKNKDFSIIKDLIASFLGIPYYSGNIDVALESIENILLLQTQSKSRAKIIYNFLFGDTSGSDLLYYIEDTFVYFLCNPWYPVRYFISIDNIQELEENVIDFFYRLFTRLFSLESDTIFVLGTNTDFGGQIHFRKFLDLLENFDDNYCISYTVKELSYPDSLTLYSHALNNPAAEMLSMLVNKSGNRPYDIIMTIKYLHDQNVLRWISNSIWYIEDYQKFGEFIKTIPEPNKKMIQKRIKLLQSHDELWACLMLIIKSLLYFQGKVPLNFLRFMELDERQTENAIDTALVKFADKTPDIVFFHDNIFRFFEKSAIYTYDRRIARSIIEWAETLEDEEKPENISHILFRCYLDVKDYDSAYRYGVQSAKEYEKNYNYQASNTVWSALLSNIELSLPQEFNVRYSLANSYREHLSQNRGAAHFNELYSFYLENKNEINLTEKERDNFYHKLINANLVTDNLQKALEVADDYEKNQISSIFYKMILLDRYAIIHLGLGNKEDSLHSIESALKIAENENINLWKSIVYSDYGYIAYRALNDKQKTKEFFKKANDCQDYERQTLHRKSELLHQNSFYHILKFDFEKAFSDAKESVALCKKLGSSFMCAKALNVLALACLELGHDDEAMEHWKEASYLCTVTENSNTHIRICINLGAYHLINGRNKEANENFEIALKLFEKSNYHETSYRELFYNYLIFFYNNGKEKEIDELFENHSFPELSMLYEDLSMDEQGDRNFDVLRIKNGYFSF